ncbi:serine hydrolase domain-containing protein [Flexithrix dorotheae]|uniref:serine hydrolase domain-containing protein n=1 Tax=Flexithrix dorotheae TaxID=70993 RepID=UPI0012F94A9D|nr:serine hydrolase [Flexithrix dorotheae]
MLEFFLIVIAFSLIALSLYLLCQRFLPIATGFAAKLMASAFFIGLREPVDVKKNELKKAWFVKLRINEKQGYVKASVLGFFSKKCWYHPATGCHLGENSDGFSFPHVSVKPCDDLQAEYDSDIQKIVRKAFVEKDIKNPLNTRAIMVIHQDKIIAENYAAGYGRDIPQAGWSLAKSITNAVTGILVKEKAINIYEEIPKEKLLNKQHRYSIHQLLRMETGLQFADFHDKLKLAEMLFNQPDVFEFGQKLIQKPLENFSWRYSSVHSNILSGVIKSYFSSLEDYLAFPYQMLFRKLGMDNTYLEVDPGGNFVGSSFVYASPMDYAKFGLLYLNDGKWNGEQILPEGWVEYSRSPSQLDKYGQYGAHFWKNAKMPVPGKTRHWPNLPNDLFYASGYQGQNIIIIPSKKTVIVRLGLTFDYERWNFGEMVEDILIHLRGANNTK